VGKENRRSLGFARDDKIGGQRSPQQPYRGMDRAAAVYPQFSPPWMGTRPMTPPVPQQAWAVGMTNWRVAAYLGSGGGGWTESTNEDPHTYPDCSFTPSGTDAQDDLSQDVPLFNPAVCLDYVFQRKCLDP
jgi:hypothetical protein